MTDADDGGPGGAASPDRTAARQELIAAAAMQARVHQNAYDRFEDAAAAYFGVSRRAMRCLDLLDRLGQQTAGELATQTGLSSGAVTAMLDRLEQAGLARRMPDPADRRRVLVQMTDRARDLAADVYGPIAEAVAEFDQYTDAELRLLAEFLRSATSILQAHADRVENSARDQQQHQE